MTERRGHLRAVPSTPDEVDGTQRMEPPEVWPETRPPIDWAAVDWEDLVPRLLLLARLASQQNDLAGTAWRRAAGCRCRRRFRQRRDHQDDGRCSYLVGRALLPLSAPGRHRHLGYFARGDYRRKSIDAGRRRTCRADEGLAAGSRGRPSGPGGADVLAERAATGCLPISMPSTMCSAGWRG